jgi:hypothetical protein
MPEDRNPVMEEAWNAYAAQEGHALYPQERTAFEAGWAAAQEASA